MFLTERAGEAVPKLCVHDFRVFEAPRAFARGNAGNGEHVNFLCYRFDRHKDE